MIGILFVNIYPTIKAQALIISARALTLKVLNSENFLVTVA